MGERQVESRDEAARRELAEQVVDVVDIGCANMVRRFSEALKVAVSGGDAEIVGRRVRDAQMTFASALTGAFAVVLGSDLRAPADEECVVCDVTAPDADGNHDLIENSACPQHGYGGARPRGGAEGDVREPPAAYAENHVRTPGDDVIIQLRVRRANLPQLEAGVTLGEDARTGQPIEFRLMPQPDGFHALEVVTNPFPYLLTPDPVDTIVIPPPEGVDHAD